MLAPVRILFLVLIFAGTAAASSLPYDRIGNIRASYRGGGNATGILIDSSGTFLTNLHNIWPCADVLGEPKPWQPRPSIEGRDCPAANLEVEFPLAEQPFSVRGARILAIGRASLEGETPVQDWALLRLDVGGRRSFSEIRFAFELNDGESIQAVGVPVRPLGWRIGSTRMHRTAGRIVPKAAVRSFWLDLYAGFGLSEGDFRRLLEMVDRHFFEPPEQFLHDMPVIAGYSGGPVFNAKQELVGLVWGGIGVWDPRLGDQPRELGIDPSRPGQAGNRLTAGIKIGPALQALRSSSRESAGYRRSPR